MLRYGVVVSGIRSPNFMVDYFYILVSLAEPDPTEHEH